MSGKQPPTIQDELGLSTADFDSALREILESYATQLASQPVEHVYAQFAIDMTAILRKLDTKAAEASARDSVAAYKAMADIRHTMLKEARQMGVVRVAGGEGSDGGTVNAWVTWISQLSNEEIRAQILSVVQEFKSIDPKLVANGMLDADKADLFSGESIFADSSND